MLKRLFYGSASILMLALAYHVGAQSAQAQAQGIAPSWIGDAGNGHLWAFAVVGRTPYSSNNLADHGVFPPIPGTGSIIAISATNTDDKMVLAMLDNGDMYAFNNFGGGSNGTPAWYRVGNVFAGSTPAHQQTWGQLKAQYRK